MESKLTNYIFITYYPNLYDSYFHHSFFGKLIKSSKIKYSVISIFDFMRNNKMKSDDKPYGSHGMIMRFDFFYKLLNSINLNADKRNICFIHPSPSGYKFDTVYSNDLSQTYDTFVFLCSRYEGVDARIITYYNFLELSIGDYILYDGDTAAMVILNSITRNLFVKKTAKINESFDNNLLEHEQYTKPIEYLGMHVPPVYLSGNHEMIDRFSMIRSLYLTMVRRQDVYIKYNK